MAAFSSSFRQSTNARSSKTHRGVARTAWSAGAPTAVAAAESRVGTRDGAQPLSQALDELRDAITPLTEQEGAKLFKDVWAARDGYIDVILDRSAETAGSLSASSIRRIRLTKQSGSAR